jgi:hypothetical protein
LVGRAVGVGGAATGVLVGIIAASVAAGKVGAGVPCAAGAVASPPPPPQAASSMDVVRIQPSTILKRGAFPEMNISYSSSAMELDLVMVCKTDDKHKYLGQGRLMGAKTHRIAVDRVSSYLRYSHLLPHFATVHRASHAPQ